MKKFFIFVFVLFSCGLLFAQSPAKYAWYSTSSGTRIMAPVGLAPAASSLGARQAIWSQAVVVDGGLPKVTGSGAFLNPRGVLVPVVVDATVLGSGSAAAIGRALPKLLRAVSGPLVIGGILYDLGKELDFELSKDGAGDLIVQTTDSDICIVAPCYEYRFDQTSNGGADSGWRATRSQAAAAYVIAENALHPPCPAPGVDFTQRQIYSTFTLTNAGADFVRQMKDCWTGNLSSFPDRSLSHSTRSVAPASSNFVPSSRQAFIDAIAAKSGWPSGSKLAPVLRDALNFEPSPAVDVSPLVVSGPATTPGPTTTTANATDNTTKTITTTYNHTYSGDTVTTTTTTQTTKINNIDNSVISTELTTIDTDVQAVVDPCIANPTRAGCVALGEVPEGEKITALDVPVTFASVVFGSSSGCPAGIPFSMFGISYSISYAPMCDLMLLLRPLFLALGAAAAAWLFMEGLKV